MRTSEAFSRVADTIAVHGHWQKGQPRGGEHCILTGLTEVMDGESIVGPMRAFAAYVGWGLDVASAHATVIAWNDAPSRTQAEVVATLREVAAIEAEAERIIAGAESVQVVIA